jgi:hypothetical protein
MEKYDDHVADTTPDAMTQNVGIIAYVEHTREKLVDLINNLTTLGADAPQSLRRELNSLTVTRDYYAYIASLSAEEVVAAIEEYKKNGYSNDLLARLTPPDDFFVEGNETRH